MVRCSSPATTSTSSGGRTVRLITTGANAGAGLGSVTAAAGGGVCGFAFGRACTGAGGGVVAVVAVVAVADGVFTSGEGSSTGADSECGGGSGGHQKSRCLIRTQ